MNGQGAGNNPEEPGGSGLTLLEAIKLVLLNLRSTSTSSYFNITKCIVLTDGACYDGLENFFDSISMNNN